MILIMKSHFNFLTMKYTSNQFPKPIKEIVKQSFEPTHEKAKTIFLAIKENCPNLYKYIKAKR